MKGSACSLSKFAGKINDMVFSSSVFLFAFFPIVIAVYYMLKESLRNYWLLLASLVFYAWNKPSFLRILLAGIFLNYAGAYLISLTANRSQAGGVKRQTVSPAAGRRY